MNKGHSCLIILVSFILSACGGQNKCYQEDMGTFIRLYQKGGRTLGLSKESGVAFLYDGTKAFKDLDRNGIIDPYEDWRLSSEERSADLASRLSIEEIAGLMLFSTHQRIPTDQWGWWPSTYEGQSDPYLAGLPSWAVSDTQKFYMTEHHMRGFLMAGIESPEVGASWNNAVQAFAESLPFGIPVNICSDPRHETEVRAEYNAGSGGQISLWPPQIGIAATFEPEIAYEHGRVLAEEFRALGIATVLAPQADLATEPRWSRVYGTFGESPALATDLVRAYIDGCQTSPKALVLENGWGIGSVNAMVKHWPGGGPEEGGRDAHYSSGKYCVYPGENLRELIVPFVKGALKLKGKTRSTAAVMPYYTISYGVDPSGANVGNGFSHYLITDMLRGEFSYDGVVCTDWGIVLPYEGLGWTNGRPWGVESLDAAHLHFKILEAGVDQFGGADSITPILGAYRLWCEKYGEDSARSRFEQSARRLLMNMFRTGLFDDPYVDVSVTSSILGCPEYMQKGYQAQQKSVIMVKNHNSVLPIDGRKKVYLPRIDGSFCADSAVVARYYDVTSCADSADFALVYITAPGVGTGYELEDRENGGNGYVPISLQYEDYTADEAREVSIAGGDPCEDFTNRSYRGKTVRCSNSSHLQVLRQTKTLMGEKPVVAAVLFCNPFVPASVDECADAVLLLPYVQQQTALDIVSGAFEPYGLLPVQMPSDMNTVERQFEDVPFDMDCYVDSDGHTYDFAYGLDWDGVINDKRVKKYKK